MGREKALWPAYKSKDRISYSDLPEFSPERYAEIGKHFTVRQFRNVEDALGAPAGFNLLSKMRRAVYLYHFTEAARASEIGLLRYLPKNKRVKTVATLLKNTESYLAFIFTNEKAFLALSSQRRVEALQLNLIGFIEDAKRKHAALEAEIDPGRVFAAWQIYFGAIALIYEAAHDQRAKIHRKDVKLLYGPFLEFARECLTLIGLSMSDENIRSALRKFEKKREQIMQSPIYASFRAC